MARALGENELKSERKAISTDRALVHSQCQGASTEVPSPSFSIKAALEGRCLAPLWASVPTSAKWAFLLYFRL